MTTLPNRYSLPSIVNMQLMRNDRKGVLISLSRITSLNNTYQLFAEYDEEYLHYVGQFRVQLLIEWKMYREALAWTCLECELYPDNLDAYVLKEYLKDKICNLPKQHRGKHKELPEWKGVAGMFQLKAMIERDILLPMKEKVLYKRFNIPVPNGFLFYGPPGCGKTFFARKIAERIGYNFIEIKPSDIGSTYVHGTQLELRRLFDEARTKAPCILFIDEIEAMAPSRTNSDVSFHYKAEVNELLTQLDNKQNEGLIIIGATNLISNIDDAVLRPGRFDKKIFIGPPDLKARAEAFRLYLDNYPQDKLRYDLIAELSENYTYAEIEYICNEIKRQAIAVKRTINTDFVCSHVSSFNPKLTDNEMGKYF